MFNFFKNYGKVKAETMGEKAVRLTAALDSEGVAETAIKQKQDEHSLVVQQVIEARRDYDREKKEFDDLYALYQRKLVAAEAAKQDSEANPENAEAAAAFHELIASVEQMAPALEREKAEYEQAGQYLHEVQQASEDIAGELMALRETITQTSREIKQAEIANQRAEKKRRQAEVLAGLRASGNKFDVAMKALQDKAAMAKAKADENNLIASQLGRPKLESSTAAQKYLDGAAPKRLGSDESMDDKLARLKRRLEN